MTPQAANGTNAHEPSPRSRLRFQDLWPLATLGLRGRPARAVLSIAGIAVGIATMVAVLGISSSSRSQLVAEIDSLGTNLLTITPGQSLTGENVSLPKTAPAMIARIGPVLGASAIADVNAAVYRNNHVPAANTDAITVYGADTNLMTTLKGTLAHGQFLNAATAHYPAVVLGADAATALGIDRADATAQLWLGNTNFTVIGILNRLPLAPELDRTAIIGLPIAATFLHADGSPAQIYVRTDPTNITAVQSVLAATADPAAPQDVVITNPSDALIARADASATFQSLFLALGGVALLVGAIGIANVMVIAVLERRGEIGLRRALGARRPHIATQFVAEAALLATIGGTTGAILGAFATTIYATTRHWNAVIHPPELAAAVLTALLTGTIAGLYPAAKAAQLPPSDALRTI